MLRPNHLRFRTWVFVGAEILLFCGVCKPAQQQPIPEVSLTVVVIEAETGDPVSQARLTLTFKQQGRLHRSISYSAKTNAQGRYRFTNIPKETVRLLVTADRHQSFGKEIEVEEDNQVIEVKLKKPQPLL
ncbi:MAG: carboxypeptidase-like regulatory domain-containing protein [Terriglobia bacterium]|jgi:5-hydroxyisourate hydrolase-like protein (transthyretin family)